MFLLVLGLQWYTYRWKPTTFVHLRNRFVFSKKLKSEIFFSGSSNFRVAKMGKIRKSSKNWISHWILHPYYLQEYGITFLPSYSVEIISSMWGVDPPTNRASVNSMALRGEKKCPDLRGKKVPLAKILGWRASRGLQSCRIVPKFSQELRIGPVQLPWKYWRDDLNLSRVNREILGFPVLRETFHGVFNTRSGPSCKLHVDQ